MQRTPQRKAAFEKSLYRLFPGHLDTIQDVWGQASDLDIAPKKYANKNNNLKKFNQNKMKSGRDSWEGILFNFNDLLRQFFPFVQGQETLEAYEDRVKNYFKKMKNKEEKDRTGLVYMAKILGQKAFEIFGSAIYNSSEKNRAFDYYNQLSSDLGWAHIPASALDLTTLRYRFQNAKESFGESPSKFRYDQMKSVLVGLSEKGLTDQESLHLFNQMKDQFLDQSQHYLERLPQNTPEAIRIQKDFTEIRNLQARQIQGQKVVTEERSAANLHQQLIKSRKNFSNFPMDSWLAMTEAFETLANKLLKGIAETDILEDMWTGLHQEATNFALSEGLSSFDQQNKIIEDFARLAKTYGKEDTLSKDIFKEDLSKNTAFIKEINQKGRHTNRFQDALKSFHKDPQNNWKIMENAVKNRFERGNLDLFQDLRNAAIEFIDSPFISNIKDKKFIFDAFDALASEFDLENIPQSVLEKGIINSASVTNQDWSLHTDKAKGSQSEGISQQEQESARVVKIQNALAELFKDIENFRYFDPSYDSWEAIRDKAIRFSGQDFPNKQSRREFFVLMNHQLPKAVSDIIGREDGVDFDQQYSMLRSFNSLASQLDTRGLSEGLLSEGAKAKRPLSDL